MVIRKNFAKDVQFANAARNKLGVLRSEIKDKYVVLHAQKYFNILDLENPRINFS